MKKLLVLFVALAMIASVSASVGPSWIGSGWAPCNPNGNYGGDTDCWVAWDGVDYACAGANRDAEFQVGTDGVWLTELKISHLDGIAETMDSFEVLDEAGAKVCEFTDPVAGPGEEWKTLTCDVSKYSGVQTFTIHPLAVSPWSQCDAYGQVAIRSIVADTDGQVPEFGVIAGIVALVGALGIFMYRRH